MPPFLNPTTPMASAVQIPGPPSQPHHPPGPPRPSLPHLLNLPTPTPTPRPRSLRTHHRPHDQTPARDVVSWTSSISAHCRSGHLREALSSFSAMLSSEVRPTPITLVTVLSACADHPSPTSLLPLGRSIHALVLKCFPDEARRDVFLGTSLVGLYAKCGQVGLARRTFDRMARRNPVTWNSMIVGHMRSREVDEAVALLDEMPVRDKVSWTAMIDGFVENGRHEEALLCFQAMQADAVDPDYVTVIATSAACAELGALGHGLWLHRYVQRRGLLRHVRVSNSLIDMYARCGRVELAKQLFDQMPRRTRVSWNSMIVGFAMNGHAKDALEHFAAMQDEGISPDGVSFTGALSACSHTGLVEEGLEYFDTMRTTYAITPRIEHYGCLVDLLSRAGHLEDATEVARSMPMKPNEVVLGSLLAACRVHGAVQLGERLMRDLIKMEPEGESGYVLLSNIYAATGEWGNVGIVRKAMKAHGIRKKPGFSAVEIDGSFHEFTAGDKSRCDSEEFFTLFMLLSHEIKLCGYVPELGDISSD